MSERKSPHWPLLAAGLIGLSVLYPLSIGPVFWVFHKTGAPDWVWQSAHFIYEPFWNVIPYAPESVYQWFIEYRNMGSPPIGF